MTEYREFIKRLNIRPEPVFVAESGKWVIYELPGASESQVKEAVSAVKAAGLPSFTVRDQSFFWLGERKTVPVGFGVLREALIKADLAEAASELRAREEELERQRWEKLSPEEKRKILEYKKKYGGEIKPWEKL